MVQRSVQLHPTTMFAQSPVASCFLLFTTIVIASLLPLCYAFHEAPDPELYRCPSHLHHYRDGQHLVETFRNKCYEFYNSEKKWTDARTYCEGVALGGGLVEIYDSATMSFLKGVLYNLPWTNNGVWNAANDRQDEKRWHWVKNHAPLGYSYWARGQPNKGWFNSNNDCAVMKRGDDWRWRDVGCSTAGYTYKFVCMFDMKPATTTTTTTTTSTTTSSTTSPTTSVTTSETTSATTSATTSLTTSVTTSGTTSHTTSQTTSDITSVATSMTTAGTTSETTNATSVISSPTTPPCTNYVSCGDPSAIEGGANVHSARGRGEQGAATDDDGKILSEGGLIGIIVAAMLLLVILIVLVAALLIRRRSKDRRAAAEANIYVNGGPPPMSLQDNPVFLDTHSGTAHWTNGHVNNSYEPVVLPPVGAGLPVGAIGGKVDLTDVKLHAKGLDYSEAPPPYCVDDPHAGVQRAVPNTYVDLNDVLRQEEEALGAVGGSLFCDTTSGDVKAGIIEEENVYEDVGDAMGRCSRDAGEFGGKDNLSYGAVEPSGEVGEDIQSEVEGAQGGAESSPSGVADDSIDLSVAAVESFYQPTDSIDQSGGNSDRFDQSREGALAADQLDVSILPADQSGARPLEIDQSVGESVYDVPIRQSEYDLLPSPPRPLQDEQTDSYA